MYKDESRNCAHQAGDPLEPSRYLVDYNSKWVKEESGL